MTRHLGQLHHSILLHPDKILAGRAEEKCYQIRCGADAISEGGESKLTMFDESFGPTPLLVVQILRFAEDGLWGRLSSLGILMIFISTALVIIASLIGKRLTTL